MWQSIENQLTEQLQRPFSITERGAVTGGDIHQAHWIENEQGERFFVKFNDRNHLAAFCAEADSLKQLASSQSVQVPQVIHVGTTKHHAFLVLEFLPCKPLQSPEQAAQFGRNLAALHLWGEQPHYGFDQDNYLATNLQNNRWQKRWSRFFAEQRFGWQLMQCAEKGLVFGDIDRLIERCQLLLNNHQPKPSLLHGDLWQGNAAMGAHGPLCFDPASYWGDRECDLAMSELFGRFPDAFYQSYHEAYPIDEGYAQRKGLYQLYHLLQHCHLFGGHFLEKTHQQMANQGLLTLEH
ncbi:putative ketoamine kinase [Vibrio stylophorae]|uniref:Ketoamine kinase n=1 Tax=Vibrio stylophorae TaxID=659351 RepID=A0ABM8ZSZ3_9VIBR|nr:fructosamine kinase family protein [Vibrio stylophorae]CAH0533416.1 putative ketoamine kinase [Vibrio stylophorae]